MTDDSIQGQIRGRDARPVGSGHSDPRMRELVKLFARRAAERDYAQELKARALVPDNTLAKE